MSAIFPLLELAQRVLPRGGLVLLAGTVSARILSTGGLVVTASIFGPTPYAALGIYVGMLSLLSVAACGRYEAAILSVRDEGDARALVRLSQWICAGFLVIVSAACALTIAMRWNELLSLPPMAVAMLPAGIVGRVGLRIENLVLIRAGRPVVRARAAVLQSVLQPVVTLTSYKAGLDPLLALIVGDSCGHLSAIALLAIGNRHWRRIHAARRDLLSYAKQWRQMLMPGLPNAFLSIAFDSAPALFAGFALPAHLGGQMILALRLLDIPGFLASFVAVPTLQRAIVEDKTSLRYAWRPTLRLALAIGGMFLIIICASHLISPLFLHTRWPELFRLVQWFAPTSALLAVNNPLVELVAIYGLERSAFPRHCAALVALALFASGLLVFGARVPSLALLLACAAMVRVAMFAHLLFVRARSI